MQFAAQRVRFCYVGHHFLILFIQAFVVILSLSHLIDIQVFEEFNFILDLILVLLEFFNRLLQLRILLEEQGVFYLDLRLIL